MKLTTTLLLLVAASCCLFQGCTAGVIAVPQAAIAELKIGDEQAAEAIIPLNVEPSVEEADAEATVFDERELYVEPITEDEDDYVEPENELVPLEPVVDDKPEGRTTACKINIRKSLPKPQPVYLKSGTNEFYPYDDSGVMVVESGRNLELWCPGRFASIDKTIVSASCVSGTNFRVDGTTYSFKELTCKSWPGFVAEKTGSRCNGGVEVRVGFKISSSRFVDQYKVCFNEDEEVTRYVHHDLNPGSNYYQTAVERLTFQTGGFFGGKNVDKLYTQNTQKATINAHLGGDAGKYFNSNSNIYLARGHLAAKADFDYGTQQRATFLFINAAPQWQGFNAGNWARIEDGVRAKVSKAKWYVDCWTGVYGVTTLPNTNGVQTPLYLSYDENNNGQIPVPKLYFRIVIERSTKRGIVFIGVNNPHLSLAEIKRDYIICNDVADRVNYINWKRTNINAGYSYACEVDDFKKKISHLPNLPSVSGLLI